MTLRECYEKVGEDYEEILGRLMSDQLIKKFARMFLDDKSFENLHSSLEQQKLEDAFRAAHTMKGTCQNLGFTRLYESACTVTEALRGGKNEVTQQMMDQLDADYACTISAIKEIED